VGFRVKWLSGPLARRIPFLVAVIKSTPVSHSRRQFVASIAAVPLLRALASEPTAGPSSPRLKIVVSGGHPGDPECGCAGTIARYTDLGHEVVLLYLNRGEGFCQGADPSQCGAVRTAEARKACAILKARPAFVGQYDGRAVVDNAHYDHFSRLLDAEKPDILFSPWPLDQHRDHRALALLVLDAWLRAGKKSALYYYEVTEDTMMFSPAEYVDISAPEVESRRHAACYAHASQIPEKWYPGQVALTRFRGRESGYPQAEGFLRHWQSKSALLP
jgi:N-acetylglucosamine malate deacetylase 1